MLMKNYNFSICLIHTVQYCFHAHHWEAYYKKNQHFSLLYNTENWIRRGKGPVGFEISNTHKELNEEPTSFEIFKWVVNIQPIIGKLVSPKIKWQICEKKIRKSFFRLTMRKTTPNERNWLDLSHRNQNLLCWFLSNFDSVDFTHLKLSFSQLCDGGRRGIRCFF